MKMTPEWLLQALVSSWSKSTSTKYSPDYPARGQCGVTALVVNELLGGEILKTPLEEGWHFYNRIGGRRMDFTLSQFDEAIDYQDVESSREEAFLDTNDEQYRILKEAVLGRLRESNKCGFLNKKHDRCNEIS
ncbi:YunG family protein [Desmospora profundinema]|uniref:YunG n=1 Tax=Desmospora profundinema TaxID=1571184 RepID=A0ABU1IH40_9BACL|nr:hypothetical protein [Desmospora profundinema]MDR6224089.1 hypothetical protein [Desmospora profundinema]